VAHDALRSELGAEPPPGVAALLSEDESAQLAATIRAARARQRDALAAAADGAFNHIPRLLRGPIRKIVGG
jgi:hypothetical protein